MAYIFFSLSSTFFQLFKDIHNKLLKLLIWIGKKKLQNKLIPFLWKKNLNIRNINKSIEKQALTWNHQRFSDNFIKTFIKIYLKLIRPLCILQTTTTNTNVVSMTPTTRVNIAIPGISRGFSSSPSSLISFSSYICSLKGVFAYYWTWKGVFAYYWT